MLLLRLDKAAPVSDENIFIYVHRQHCVASFTILKPGQPLRGHKDRSLIEFELCLAQFHVRNIRNSSDDMS